MGTSFSVRSQSRGELRGIKMVSTLIKKQINPRGLYMSCNLWTLNLGGKSFKFSHLIFFLTLLPASFHPFPVFNPVSCWELCWSHAPPSQFLGVHCQCQAAVALQTTAWKTPGCPIELLPFLVTFSGYQDRRSTLCFTGCLPTGHTLGPAGPHT